jgi:hypothetical protein
MLEHAAGFAGNDLCNAQGPEEPDRRTHGDIARLHTSAASGLSKKARIHASW